MKGYIAVDIPVKGYVKAYMISQLGTPLKLAYGDHAIYNKIHDLLEWRSANPDKTDSLCKYPERVKLFIPIHIYKRRGCNLNATNIRNLNTFIEDLIKEKFYFLMDWLIETRPTFLGNLPVVRKHLGIDADDWSDDSMKRDYYRSRLRRNLPLLYKTSSVNIPFEKRDENKKISSVNVPFKKSA